LEQDFRFQICAMTMRLWSDAGEGRKYDLLVILSEARSGVEAVTKEDER
jgi:hypothetical protein